MTFEGSLLVVPLYVISHSPGYGGGAFANATESTLTANRAIYVPQLWDFPFIINKFMWWNGSTVAGNVDVGLYDESLTRLTSTGSVARSGASSIQEADVTDLYVSPGRYYLAYAHDSATATTLVTTWGFDIGRVYGHLDQASAFPLPASGTGVTFADTSVPVFGIVTR